MINYTLTLFFLNLNIQFPFEGAGSYGESLIREGEVGYHGHQLEFNTRSASWWNYRYVRSQKNLKFRFLQETALISRAFSEDNHFIPLLECF
jgi:hypothetical protein